MLDNTLVSVIIPTYERPQLLQRALESVVAQTYQNLEILVIDDGQFDTAEAICAGFSDPRISYHRNQKSKGACGARNTGLELATGHYYAGLDDDDTYVPERIEVLLRAYRPDYAFVSSSSLMVAKTGTWPHLNIQRTLNLSDILWGNCAGSPVLTELYKVQEVGGYDESLRSSQDWDLWVRLIERWGSALRLKDILYHIHSDHEMPRIKTSSGKIQGLLDAFAKHTEKMNDAQRLAFDLKLKKLQNKPYRLRAVKALSKPSIVPYFLRRVTKLW